MGSIFGGGAAQNNANQDQGDINAAFQQFFSQVAPGLMGVVGANGTNPNINTSAGLLSGLASGNTQQGQIQSLSNTFNNANTSALNTEKSQLGGVANPAGLLRGLQTQNAQSGMQNTQNLQSGLAGQEISAASGLGSLGQGQMSNVLQALLGYSSGLSGLAGGAQQNQAYNQGLANQTQNANEGLFGSLLGGLASGGLGSLFSGAGATLFPGSSTSSTLP